MCFTYITYSQLFVDNKGLIAKKSSFFFQFSFFFSLFYVTFAIVEKAVEKNINPFKNR